MVFVWMRLLAFVKWKSNKKPVYVCVCIAIKSIGMNAQKKT